MNQTERLLHSLENCNTVTISSADPFLKTVLLLMLCVQNSSSGLQSHYFDVDLQFSSLISSTNILQALPRDIGRQLLIHQVIDSASDEAVAMLARSDLQQGGLIVLDSVNSVQALLRGAGGAPDSMAANHRAAVIVTLFQGLAATHSKLLVMSNIEKLRPHTGEGQTAWQKEIVGGRMIKFKSDVILSVSRIDAASRSEGLFNLSVSAIADDCNTDLHLGEVFEFRMKYTF